MTLIALECFIAMILVLSHSGQCEDTQGIFYRIISDTKFTESTKENDEGQYFCGFTRSHPYASIRGVLGTSPDSDIVIEQTFMHLWHNVIGGNVTAIEVKKDADENNASYQYAAATGNFSSTGNLTRQIFYKSNDLSPLITRSNGWLLKAIALHELGHHINNDPFSGVTRDTAELGADDYAGFILGRLNATLDTAIMAFSTLTQVDPNNGYPNRERRIAAVQAGWERSKLSLTNSIAYALIKVKGRRSGFLRTDRHMDYEDIEKAVKRNSSDLYPLKDTFQVNMIKLVTEASGSPGEFYIDSNFLYFKNPENLAVVGRVAQSNLKEYNRMVYDKFYHYIYIDGNNALITYIPSKTDPRKSSERIIVGYLATK